jgi:serine/threonine protein phosphatase PrpC
VLSYQREGKLLWKGHHLTKAHKPKCLEEVARVVKAGGKVVKSTGGPRVIWNRPRKSSGDGDSVRLLTDDDEIPFFPLTQCLGAYWSYSWETYRSVVSEEPDFMVIPVDVGRNRCLIMGTHGLWDVLRPTITVVTVGRGTSQL